MKTYKLTPELSVTELGEVAQAEVSSGLSKIFFIDTSGSMWATLQALKEDVKKQIRQCEVGDAVSVLWFSGKNQFDYVVRLHRITGEQSFDDIDTLIDRLSTKGMTCFSESLNALEGLLDESAVLGLRTSFVFFTDGCPNTPSVTSEHKSSLEILERLRNKIDMFLAVAYGNYADRDFLIKLAEVAGGEAISPNSLEAFSRAVHKFLRGARSGAKKTVADLSEFLKKDVVAVFSIGSEMVNTYQLADGKVGLSGRGFVITKEVTDSEVAPLEAAYASALVLSRQGRVDSALDTLGLVGDKRLIDGLNSAFIPSERGMVEELIKDAVFVEKMRFLDGKVDGYLPNPNAFCWLNLIELLAADPEVRFYPRHSEFKYNLIGRKTIQEEGYPEFQAYLENSCPINHDSWVWNETKLNLSLETTIKGTVKLPDVGYRKEIVKSVSAEGEKQEEVIRHRVEKPVNLGEVKETVIHRTYTFVKDGYPNVTKMPISAGVETIATLQQEGLISATVAADAIIANGSGKESVVVLDLTNLPVVNKSIVAGDVFAKDLLENELEITILKAQIRSLNALRKEVDPNASKYDTGWSPEEREYFLSIGFSDGGSYNPPTNKADATDEYEAVSFITYIKGLKALPSFNDLRKRMTEIKSATEEGAKKIPSLTVPMTLMIPVVQEFENVSKFLPKDHQISWIDARLRAAQVTLSSVRNHIQKLKFSLLLGRKWFKDLEEAEAEQTITFNTTRLAAKSELTGIIQVRKETVEI